MKTQRGAVLIVSLVMLTILTIIAVATTTDIGLQSNMARNSQIRINVFNLAHSGLRSQFVLFRDDPLLLDELAELARSCVQTAFETPEVENDDGTKSNFSVTYDCPEENENNLFTQTDGMGMGGAATDPLLFPFTFDVELPNTGISSSQTFLVEAPNPDAVSGTR
ncbi:MAG: pilus assembly PilX N-terminal domain-containing protein [Porticoccaceae bacterium]|nr:pilus assembly PilX N-terminal domain-containing protein [Pseudomonadales bacterium]MCP5172507.1 pilus assembly PilX N-terminal domain-containing protein [Pseudomonadales bacterium]